MMETHLEYRLDYKRRDVKLKELELTACWYFFLKRTKDKKKPPVNPLTIPMSKSNLESYHRVVDQLDLGYRFVGLILYSFHDLSKIRTCFDPVWWTDIIFV